MPRCVILIKWLTFCYKNPLTNLFLFFLLLQHKVNSQQKATFDLGSILLCLTTEHLNTRQVVFMTHRLELSRSTLGQQYFSNRSLWTNYSFASRENLEDNEVNIGLLEPHCNRFRIMLNKLQYSNCIVIFCPFYKSNHPAAATSVVHDKQLTYVRTHKLYHLTNSVSLRSCQLRLLGAPPSLKQTHGGTN